MSTIKLKSICFEKTTVIYKFVVPDIIKNYLNSQFYRDDEYRLFVELPNQVDVRNVPESVLAIPFVGAMLGVAMAFNVSISVKELDRKFYDSINNIQNVFNRMYPRGNFRVSIEIEKLIDNEIVNSDEKKSSVFFTGGVDATSALLDVLDKKPLLVNIEGGDISLSDRVAHEKLAEYFGNLASKIEGLDYCFIKSNCRELVREYEFDRVYKKVINRRQWHGYWASIAHIIVMVSTIAPLLYVENIEMHYIGSSYAKNDSTFDGNNELMIEAIKYCGCQFISSDANLDRNQKVEKIVNYSKKTGVNFELQVCWYKNSGMNCSKCEKCYRTIMNILAAHGNPNDFGFVYDNNTMKEMKKFLETSIVNLTFWKQNQDSFKKEKDYWENTELNWFIDFKFNSIVAYYNKIKEKIKRKTIKAY